MKKVLVTGAHFTTALAVIEELQTYPDLKIVYVGRKTTREGDSTKSVESQVLPERGIKFIPIITGRLQKSFSPYTFISLLKIPIGLVQSVFILIKEKPDLVVSFGGYVSVPIIIVAWLLSIPIIIHEQTLVTGLANKIGSVFADKIAISYETDHEFPKEKTILTGNPIRKEILQSSELRVKNSQFENIFKIAKKEKLPVILVTGGNQGSHIINTTVEQSLDKLLKIACIIHQTGDSKFKDFERLSEIKNDRYLVSKFINKEMPYVLKNVDLVVSRAGINTLTELAYLGKPVLVIPIPYLYKNEQNKNAKFFETNGLVKILPQSKLTAGNLFEGIKDMIKQKDDLTKKASNAKAVIIPDAAKRLAMEIVLMLKQS